MAPVLRVNKRERLDFLELVRVWRLSTANLKVTE